MTNGQSSKDETKIQDTAAAGANQARLLERARRQFAAGEFVKAEDLCAQILAEDAQHGGATHLRGLMAFRRNDLSTALELLERVRQRETSNADVRIDLANALHGAGKIEEAEAALREAIALRPDSAPAHQNLAAMLQRRGQWTAAIEEMKTVRQLRPEQFEVLAALGHLLQKSEKVEEAIEAYRAALRIRPGVLELLSNLGNALKDHDELKEAIEIFRQVVAMAPGSAVGWSHLGNALLADRQWEAARKAYQEAIARDANFADAFGNLAAALRAQGNPAEAESACRKAIALRPDFPEAYLTLGGVLLQQAKPLEARAAFEHAIKLRPDYAEAYVNLGCVLKDCALMDEAIATFQKAIELHPDAVHAYGNLGNALGDCGKPEESVRLYRRALELWPDLPNVHSNFVFGIHYHPGYDAVAIRDEAARWNARDAAPLMPANRSYPNDRSPDRRLRIGYVSPDLRSHAVAFNLLPLFNHQDHGNFHITFYSNVARPDATTELIKNTADEWRSIIGMEDDAAGKLIGEDRIDILVDLSQHMGANRLMIFSRKPAPVQAAFAGYPGTTGLTAVDWRFTDPYIDPPGTRDELYSERSFRLPHSFWCYKPNGEEPLVNALPALERGYITFGCLNNYCKVNDQLLRLWGQILRAVPTSKLMVLAPRGQVRREIPGKLGVDAARVEFAERHLRARYLATCHGIDISLDTFPYNGHTTGLDSLWMGVPVVTLCGQTAASRGGFSQASNLGSTELVAYTPEQYVQIAVELANDLPRLSTLRATLRERMAASPLTDVVGFTRGIESAYRAIWRQWCAAQT